MGQTHVEVPQVHMVDTIVHVPQVVHRQVPMIQKVQRTVEIPQVEYVDNHIHIPVHKHRHVPMVSIAHKHVDVPVIQTIEKIVDVPVVKQVDVPHVTTIEKVVEVPHVQVVEKVVEVPMAGETIQGQQHAVNVPLPPVRHQAPPEHVTETVAGPDLPAEHGGQMIHAAPAPVTAAMAAPVTTFTHA